MKKLLIVLLCIGLVGCGMGRRITYYNNLKEAVAKSSGLNGLSRQQVYERFGRPDDVSTSYSRYAGRTDRWVYKHHKGKVIVVFSEGAVTDTFYH